MCSVGKCFEWHFRFALKHKGTSSPITIDGVTCLIEVKIDGLGKHSKACTGTRDHALAYVKTHIANPQLEPTHPASQREDTRKSISVNDVELTLPQRRNDRHMSDVRRTFIRRRDVTYNVLLYMPKLLAMDLQWIIFLPRMSRTFLLLKKYLKIHILA